jgi:hypothetical protein
MVKPLLEVDY